MRSDILADDSDLSTAAESALREPLAVPDPEEDEELEDDTKLPLAAAAFLVGVLTGVLKPEPLLEVNDVYVGDAAAAFGTFVVVVDVLGADDELELVILATAALPASFCATESRLVLLDDELLDLVAMLSSTP